MFKSRRHLLIWLFLACWSFAQQAVLDHLYSAEHQNDTVCEWCGLHGSSASPALATQWPILHIERAHLAPLPVESVFFDLASDVRPPVRAPPVL